MLYVRGSSSAVFSTQSCNNGAQLSGTVTANASAEELWDQVDVLLSMASSVTTGAPWVLYLIPHTADDATAGDAITPPSAIYMVASWPANTGTSAQHLTAHGISLPPGNFTYILYNNTGQNATASSVTLNRRPYHVA